jgi:hypothetical protein
MTELIAVLTGKDLDAVKKALADTDARTVRFWIDLMDGGLKIKPDQHTWSIPHGDLEIT